MRIVAWNCCRGPIPKRVLALEALHPDVAVLSEALEPTEERLVAQVAAGPEWSALSDHFPLVVDTEAKPFAAADVRRMAAPAFAGG